MTTSIIPEGYRQDAKGRLVPEDQIKEIDLARDRLVCELVEAAKKLNAELAAFRKHAAAEIAAFIDLSAEKYGAPRGGTKGNLSLSSFDGRLRVQRAIADQLVFDERLQAAKSLVDGCLKEWAADARPELVTLITDAFQVDRAGKIDTARILSLRNLKIDDARWQSAMEAIGDSLQVASTRSYIRFHERGPGDNDQYRQINLDLSNA